MPRLGLKYPRQVYKTVETQLALLYGPALLPPVFAPHLSDTDCLRNQVIQHFRATGNFPKLLHNTSRNSSNHKLSFRPVYLDSLVWPLKKCGNQILTFTPRGNKKFVKRLSEKLHVGKFVYRGNKKQTTRWVWRQLGYQRREKSQVALSRLHCRIL